MNRRVALAAPVPEKCHCCHGHLDRGGKCFVIGHLVGCDAYPLASFKAFSRISAQPFRIRSAAALLLTELLQV